VALLQGMVFSIGVMIIGLPALFFGISMALASFIPILGGLIKSEKMVIIRKNTKCEESDTMLFKILSAKSFVLNNSPSKLLLSVVLSVLFIDSDKDNPERVWCSI
jgi:hypothetical protein